MTRRRFLPLRLDDLELHPVLHRPGAVGVPVRVVVGVRRLPRPPAVHVGGPEEVRLDRRAQLLRGTGPVDLVPRVEHGSAGVHERDAPLRLHDGEFRLLLFDLLPLAVDPFQVLHAIPLSPSITSRNVGVSFLYADIGLKAQKEQLLDPSAVMDGRGEEVPLPEIRVVVAPSRAEVLRPANVARGFAATPRPVEEPGARFRRDPAGRVAHGFPDAAEAMARVENPRGIGRQHPDPRAARVRHRIPPVDQGEDLRHVRERRHAALPHVVRVFRGQFPEPVQYAVEFLPGERFAASLRRARGREPDLVEAEPAQVVERLPHVDGAVPEGHARRGGEAVLVLLQESDPPRHLLVGPSSRSVRTVPVVDLPGPVDADAHGDPVLLQETGDLPRRGGCRWW